MQTPTQQPATRPRLVEAWQTHLKYNGREPRNLLELGIATADSEHRSRLADLKAMAKKLETFDAMLPALAEQGIKLHFRDFRTYDGGKTIHLSGPFGPDDKLHQALLSQGFREVKREEYYKGSRHDRVHLKHGRTLVVVLEVSKLSAPQPAAAEVAA